MEFLMILIAIVISYLLGSLNFGIIVSKLALGMDLREHGSGNAGSTNAYRVMGPKLAVPVMIGDILKGVVASVIGNMLAGEHGRLAAMLFVVVGHIYPLYFGFKGGKGVITAAATIAIFDIRIFAVMISVFLITVLLTKYVSLGSMLAAAVFPVLMYIFHPTAACVIVALVMASAVIILHRGNIKRLIAGTESKFTFKRKNAEIKKDKNK